MTMTTVTIVNEPDTEMEGDFRRLDLEFIDSTPDHVEIFASGSYGAVYEEGRTTLSVAEAEKLVEELQKWLLKRSAARQDEQKVQILDYRALMNEQGNFHTVEQIIFGHRSRGDRVHLKVDQTKLVSGPPPSIIRLCDKVTLVYAGGAEKVIHDRGWQGVGSYQQESTND